MRFVKDTKSKSFERSVFGFLEVTGNIGGLFEILEITGGLIVGLFSGKLFLYSILPKLYHIDQPTGENCKNLKLVLNVNF